METRPHPSIRHDLSPKQQEFFYNSTAFLNCADGAVRSGKTHVCLHRFVMHTQSAPPGDMMMLGRTRETVERNAVSPLIDEYGPRRIRWNRGLGILNVAGRQVWVVGVNDAQAETKIRGATLAGSYVNEMTVLQEHAFDQLVDRHSIAGARIFGDTNPDSPFHWLMRKWLANDGLAEEDVFRVRFGLRDNPYLPSEYIARLERAHTGMWRKRNVLGEWVMAEGVIYDMFAPDDKTLVPDVIPASFEKYIVGVDYGTANKTVFLLLGLSRGVWYVIREYVHDSRASGRQKTDEEYASDFVDWLGNVRVQSVEVDPSAASFKLALKRAGVSGVRDADNSVLDGIRNVAEAFNTGALKVAAHCKNTIESLSAYAWDPKAQERGEDKPLKQNDHEADALRYAVRRVMAPQPRKSVRVVR